MTYDIDLMRKILIAIEKQYKPGQIWMFGPKIEGYDLQIIAEHCRYLQQKGFIEDFKANFGSGKIYDFRIGNMTVFGAEYLEVVRDDAAWEKIKSDLAEQDRPKIIDEVVRWAGLFTSGFTQGFTG